MRPPRVNSHFAEFPYDAFGRRVWVRTDRDCDESGAEVVVCDLSTIRRTIWDGARVLFEVQVPLRHAGAVADEPASVQDNDLYQPALPLLNFIDPNPFFGRVLYLPGLALDQPRAVVRFGYVGRVGATLVAHPPTTVSLFWSQQGQVQRAACTAAATPACVASSGAAVDSMRFPLTAYVFAFDRPAYVVRSFQGTLLEDKRDGAGTYFRRNRSYDPQTGRFTQEDPIGLAGGLNLYGFAGGDPVNFADPFGLCPYFLTGRPCTEGAAIAFGFVPIAGDAYDIASAIAGRDLLTGESLGGVEVAATFIGTIAGSGKLAREAVGAASAYAPSTKRGARVWNRATDVSAAKFGENLVESGFKETRRSDGIAIYTRGERRYVVRGPERSNSGWTADVYSSDQLLGKIRLDRR